MSDWFKHYKLTHGYCTSSSRDYGAVVVRFPSRGVKWINVLKAIQAARKALEGTKTPLHKISIFESPFDPDKEDCSAAWFAMLYNPKRATGILMLDVLPDNQVMVCRPRGIEFLLNIPLDGRLKDG